jgi:hypothetical protein
MINNTIQKELIMYNLAVSILALGLTLSSSSIFAQTTSSDNPPDKPWVPKKLTPVSPTSEIFTMDGISAKDKPPIPVPGIRKIMPTSTPFIWRWIKWSSYQCDAAWDQSCSVLETIEAPAGWQACRIIYTLAYEGGYRTSKGFSAEGWYTDDRQSPHRFRNYRLSLSASGSGVSFDQAGAKIRLENVGMDLISADTDNAGRYAAGCHMPPHD